MIRPTADRAREAIFNIIGHRVKAARVIDFFAGTGAFGLEALSRGAAQAVFIDNQAAALSLIKQNIERCGFSDRSLVIRRDLAKSLSFLDSIAPEAGFSLVFLDPPYGKGLAQEILHRLAVCARLSKDVLVIAEDNVKETLPDEIGMLSLADKRRYGDTGFWIYTMHEELAA